MLKFRRDSHAFRATCLSWGLLCLAALVGAPVSAIADAFVEPAVFSSSGGVLDILMIAKPLPVPTISFQPLNDSPPINPIGWVYQICQRPPNSNVCPQDSGTVADYGGVRLALQPGDVLKVRLVNNLPLLDPAKAKHTGEPGGANLFLNPTNLHTHGLIVPPRVPTLNDPTFGDYVFLDIYNSANGMPTPQPTHQHGAIKMDYADYRIDIPANHPSGMFWFHPHVHGLSLNQVSGGLAGIISIGNEGDYINNPPSTTRHLIMKDMQVLAAGTYQTDTGPTDFFEGEVQYQESPDFCARSPDGPRIPRQGSCPGEPPELTHSNNYTGGRWFFTINGQVYPTVNMTSPDGEIWRLTNTSGQVSYRLNLVDDSTQQPMLMQLIAIDGVSISVPPGTSAGTVMAMGGNKFTVANCPTSNSDILPVCVTDLYMMPSSRAEVWVTYRDANGNIVTPPAGASATLRQGLIDLGPAGEAWPTVDFLNVKFNQTGTARRQVDVRGNARTALSPVGIFGARPSAISAKSARGKTAVAQGATANCLPIADGHRRRIFFGVEDPTDPDTAFGLGYEEVDQNGNPVPGTQVPVTAFDPSVVTVCIPLGQGGAPVSETWELISLATEIHNFHMHQTKFSVVEETPLASGANVSRSSAPVVLEDNVPIPYSSSTIDDLQNSQGGYCTIDQWRNGDCTAHKIVVTIPFSQLGDFVYHCHILEHEDGGMMAKIRVVDAPFANLAAATHDFDGDGKSDILWRSTTGDNAIWFMNGLAIASVAGLGNTPLSWSVVGQRDFDGDGKSDFLWRSNNGGIVIWQMNAGIITANSSVGTISTNWSVVGTGDFNGDRRGDILWRSTTGDVAIWTMNGVTVNSNIGFGNIPMTWSIAGTADFNGDGKSDILWRSVAGDVAIWTINNGVIQANLALGNVPTAWSIAGTGDFNGDNVGDVMWRDTSGNIAIWLMAPNGTITSNFALGNISTPWSIVGTGDFDGDGKSDILWRDTTGNIAIWRMDGATVQNNFGMGNITTNWAIQAAGAN